MCHIKCSHINFRKSHEVQSQRGNLTVAANQIREPADEMTFFNDFFFIYRQNSFKILQYKHFLVQIHVSNKGKEQ